MGKDHHDAADEADVRHEQGAEQNVDKIRDIIFGGQMRDYERRFSVLEKSITERTDQLAADMQSRMESLDAFIRSELDSLRVHLAEERKERIEGRDQGKEDLHGLQRATEERIVRLDEKTAGEARAIRTSLHDQGAELTTLLTQTRDQLAAGWSHEAGELESRKVARQDLAELLSEMAMRLAKEFDLPESE